MAKIDDLFFELSVKRGAGSDAEVAKFTGGLKKVGTAADKTADELEDVAKATDQVDKEAKQATGTFGRLFSRLKGAAGGITALSTGFLAVRQILTDVFRAVRGLITGFGNLATRGGEVINVSRAFVSIVGDQEGALIELRAATKGLISDFDLMVQFNRAVTLGAASNIEEFAKLSETALTLGRALGLDVKFALESLNLGIARQSRLILDNLGLIISVESANEDYALALEKTVDQLTDQEKRQAFINAALTTAEEKIASLGETQLTAADNLQRLNIQFANFRDGLAVAIANSPVVAQAIDALSIAFGTLFDSLEKIIGIQAVTDPTAFVDLSALEEIILFFRVLPAEFETLSARVRVVTETIATFFSRAFGDIIDSQRDLLRELAEGFIDFSDLLINRFNPAVQLAAAAAGEFLERLGESAAQDEGFAANAERRLAFARSELLASQINLDATRARGLAEVDLTRNIAARRAEQMDLGDVEAGLRAFQALTKAIDAATVTAAERSLEAVEQLERDFVGAFGEIPAEAEKELAKLRQIAEDALGAERAKKLGEEFATAFASELEAIDLGVLVGDITEEEGQQQRLDILAAQRAEIEAQLVGLNANSAAAKALNKILAQILKAQKGITEEIEDSAEARAKKELKAIEDALKAQKEVVATIALAAQGVADLASAFGLVDDETLKVIDNVIQLGTAISSTISAVNALSAGVGDLAGLLAGGIGGIGAIAGIAGAIFGGGPSESDKVQQANTKALRELLRGVDELRGSFEITGEEFSRALQGLAPFGEVAAGGFEDVVAFTDALTALEADLAGLGLSFDDLGAIAQELGIEIFDAAGNVLAPALLQLLEALEAVEGSLIGFADSLEGTLSRIRAEFEIFDIEDPLDQLQRIQLALLGIGAVNPAQVFEILQDETLSFAEKVARLQMVLRIAGTQVAPFIDELLKFDISTAEGRAAADALLRDLFRQLSAGEITPEQLGAATFDEAVQILLQMEGLLDEIADQEEEAGGELEGQTQDIRRQVQITELQAAQLLAFQATQTELLRQIRDILRGGVPVAADGTFEDILEDLADGFLGPPQPIPVPPITAPGEALAAFQAVAGGAPENLIGEVTIRADISVGAGATPEQAEEVREILLDDIEVELGERLLDAQRQVGLPRIVRERLSR